MHANSCALCNDMGYASSPAAPSPPLAGLGAGWQTHVAWCSIYVCNSIDPLEVADKMNAKRY